jgi:hypothetical protein
LYGWQVLLHRWSLTVKVLDASLDDFFDRQKLASGLM